MARNLTRREIVLLGAAGVALAVWAMRPGAARDSSSSCPGPHD